MFRFVENQKKWVQIGLIVVSVPFIATGMLGYMDSSLNEGGAKLVEIEGGHAIPDTQFEQKWTAYRQSKPSSPLSLSDQKQFILDLMIQEQLLSLYAERQKFSVSVDAVRERIASEPAFRDETGKFSLAQYQGMLKQIGSSEDEFEETVRKSLARRSVDRVMQPWLAQPLVDYLIRAYEMQWVTRKAVFSWEQYAKDIVIDEAAARVYYNDHLKQYAEPAKIQIETLEASSEAAQKAVTVTPEEIAAYYEQNKAQYISPEMREVRHILLKVDPKATPEEKSKKKGQIEAWLKELRAAPEKFAAYASQHSEDTGSATEGGSLGEIGRGSMVKPFEDAVFAAPAGSLTGPVETEFGYHLIQVGAVKPAVQKPLAEAQADLESALRRSKSRALHESWVLKLEQSSENLAALAKETGMPLNRSDWLAASAVAAQLNGKEGLAAQLMDSAQKGDYKPLPVQDVGSQKFIVIRPVAYQAPYQPKFEDIKAKVIADAQREKALVKAREEGIKRLKSLQAKEQVTQATQPLTWTTPETLVFRRPNSLSPELQKQVMQLHPKGAPLYTGAEDANGYTVVAVDAVINSNVDDTKRAQVKPILGQLWAEQGYRAFTQGLRKLYGVKINDARWKQILNRQEEPVGALPVAE